jgi:hypothetical protein
MRYTCDPIKKIHIISYMQRKKQVEKFGLKERELENEWELEMGLKHPLPSCIWRNCMLVIIRLAKA